MDEHQSGVKLEEALEAKKELDAKAQKILEEKEADSRMRTYTGPYCCACGRHSSCISRPSEQSVPSICGRSTVSFFLFLHFYYFRRLKKKRGKESFRPFGTWRLSFVPQAVSFISF